VDLGSIPQLGILAAIGVGAGLVLLVQGFSGYRTAARIGDTSTSRIASLAIGEVRVSGVVEAAGVTLVSPLQSVDCVYYRSSIRASDGDIERTVLEDERAVGFRVRDDSGDVRVFPRGAAFDVPDTFDEGASMDGDSPPGLRFRSGSAFGETGLDRATQIAALLTVRPAASSEAALSGGGGSPFSVGVASIGGRHGRRYREARIEPGQVVTVVGRVLPFDQLDDPDGADRGGASAGFREVDDPEIAADLAEARAAGVLADSAAEAWGNAAIPGFGIGAPVSTPELHPEANVPRLADASEADRARRTFEIGPHDLVIAAAEDVPLLIAQGPPTHAVARHERRFLLGLLGAVLAIGSAVVLAVLVGGGIAT
jgi:hypothetical protein